MDKKVKVYIEIEKDSNTKYELNKELNILEIDRILPYPYFYPYSYGFITETLAMDDDELDALIIVTDNKKIERDKFYDVFIIGVLIMSDEKGKDEKVLCVLEEDYETIKDLNDLSNEIKENIHWFFSSYKSKTPNKWSIVDGFENKEAAIELHKRSLLENQ